MTHHSLHTTHFTPHHLSYRAHLTPLISQHSSYATSLSPVISQHSNMRYSSYTTQLIPNAYSGERHKTSHVGLSGPFILNNSGLDGCMFTSWGRLDWCRLSRCRSRCSTTQDLVFKGLQEISMGSSDQVGYNPKIAATFRKLRRKDLKSTNSIQIDDFAKCPVAPIFECRK